MRPSFFPTLSCFIFVLTACHATSDAPNVPMRGNGNRAHHIVPVLPVKELGWVDFLTYTKAKLGEIKLAEASPFRLCVRQRGKLRLYNLRNFIDSFDSRFFLDLDSTDQLIAHHRARLLLATKLDDYLLGTFSFYALTDIDFIIHPPNDDNLIRPILHTVIQGVGWWSLISALPLFKESASGAYSLRALYQLITTLTLLIGWKSGEDLAYLMPPPYGCLLPLLDFAMVYQRLKYQQDTVRALYEPREKKLDELLAKEYRMAAQRQQWKAQRICLEKKCDYPSDIAQLVMRFIMGKNVKNALQDSDIPEAFQRPLIERSPDAPKTILSCKGFYYLFTSILFVPVLVKYCAISLGHTSP